MRRLGVLVLVGTFVFTFVGAPASRAATVSSTWPVGAGPFGVALDDPTGKVFVANSGSVVYDIQNPSAPPHGLISVVDPATGSVGRILTSQTSNFVLTDPANRRLYSSNAAQTSAELSLDVFDLDSGGKLATVAGVGGLMPALDAPLGRLFVGGNGLAVIDTATNTVIASMAPPAGGSAWFGAAVDASRHRLYLSDAASTNPRLYVFDDRDLSPIREVPIGGAVRYAIAVSSNGQVIVGAADTMSGTFAGSALYVIDPDTLSIVHTTSIPGAPNGVALAASNHRIHISDGYGQRVYSLDDVTFEVAETIARLPFVPGMPLYHPDGRLYVGNYNSASGNGSTLVALDLANHGPVFGSLSVSPSAPRTNDVLTASASASDPDLRPMAGADPTTLTYEWLRNGVVIGGETRSSLDLSVSGRGDRGDTITVRVTASDGQLSTVASTSVVIADSAPTGAVNLNNTAPATNAVVSAGATVTDADNDPLSYRFVWKVNGIVRRTTSGVNASDSFDLAPAGNGDHGDGVTVELVASDGTLESGVATAGATVVNTAPTVAVSLNTTTPATKSVLTATVLGQDVDNDGLTYVYTWRVNGVVKRTVTTTASTDRYDLSVRGNGDKGDVVTVTVTATDGSLTSPSATANATVRNR